MRGCAGMTRNAGGRAEAAAGADEKQVEKVKEFVDIYQDLRGRCAARACASAATPPLC
jgi:hypothetical protein